MTIRTNEKISLSQDYLIMIKNKLEEERISGQYTNSKGEIKYPYSSFSYVDEVKLYKSTSISYYEDYAVIKTQKRNFNSWQQARRFFKKNS